MQKRNIPRFRQEICDNLKSLLPLGYTYWQILYHHTYIILEKNRGNRTHTAMELDISIRTLRLRLIEMRYCGFPIPDSNVGNPEIIEKIRWKRENNEQV